MLSSDAVASPELGAKVKTMRTNLIITIILYVPLLVLVVMD